jgi:hypothetical protein
MEGGSLHQKLWSDGGINKEEKQEMIVEVTVQRPDEALPTTYTHIHTYTYISKYNSV